MPDEALITAPLPPASNRKCGTSSRMLSHMFLAGGSSLQVASLINTGTWYLTRRASEKSVTAGYRGVERTERLLIHIINATFRSDRVRSPLLAAVNTGCNAIRAAMSSFGEGFRNAAEAAHAVTAGGLEMTLRSLGHVEAGVGMALSMSKPLETETGTSAWSALQSFASIFAPLTAASPVELTKATAALSGLQAETHTPYPPRESPLLDLAFIGNQQVVDELCYRYKQTLAAYDRRILQLCDTGLDGDSIRELFGVDSEAILLREENSRIHRPAYFLILDHTSRSICLVIRGSVEAADLFTDFCCTPDEEWGCHSGMAAAARHINHAVRPTVMKLAYEYPDYAVVAEGHSLGGGVATLLAWLWKDEPVLLAPGGKNWRLRCFSFAAPCAVPPVMGNELRDCLTSVIYARDLVTRGCPTATVNAHAMLVHLAGGKLTEKEKNEANEMNDVGSRHIQPVSSVDDIEMMNSTSTTTDSENFTYEPPLNLDSVRTAAVLDALRQWKTIKDDTGGDTQTALKARALLRDQMDSLRSMTTNEGILCPGGRSMLVVPAEDMIAAHRELPEFLTPGACVIFDLTQEDLELLVREPVFHAGALADHFPHRLGSALGLFIPNSQ